ncbi:MAG: hypothetical protein B6244_05820 [Candidatus Cloacimonetes bacterium 4572_55]|nr:MAG: hypothetical protein B6244_05820 [Candidatus Cloacimonetes bacterium 4572_55]
MDDSFLSKFIAFILLIISSGFFSGLEIALSSLNAVDIHRLQEKGGYSEKLMNLWSVHPGRVLTGILIGNNLVNVAAASIASVISLNVARAISLSQAYALAVATGVVTFLILILGEITPKTFAKQNSSFFVKIASVPLIWFLRIFSIPSYLLTKIAMMIIYMLGGQTKGDHASVTEEDIRDMIRVGEQEGIIHSQERQIMHSVFDFSTTPARKVMTPRMDIVAIPYKAKISELLELMVKTKFSRIPIYMQNLDNIIGIAYAKHAMQFWRRNLNDMNVVECQVFPIQIPETKRLGDLLFEFQQKKSQLAIVFDEFGQTSGLVTLEDIIEELIGEVWDENENRDAEVIRVDDMRFIAFGHTKISQLNRYFGVDIPDGNYNTVAGWVNWVFGHIPKQSETIEYEDLVTIEALEVKRNKILKVMLIFKDNRASEHFNSLL